MPKDPLMPARETEVDRSTERDALADGLKYILWATLLLSAVFLVGAAAILYGTARGIDLDPQQPVVWWVSIVCSLVIFASQLMLLAGLWKCGRAAPAESRARPWISLSLMLVAASFGLSLIVYVATLTKPGDPFPVPPQAQYPSESVFDFDTVFLASLNFVIISCQGLGSLALLAFLRCLAGYVGQLKLKIMATWLIGLQLVFTVIGIGLVGVAVMAFALDFNVAETPTSIFTVGSVGTVVFLGTAIATLLYFVLLQRLQQSIRPV
jgi:hypothetical protein